MRGGKRSGAGRPVGPAQRASKEAFAKAAEGGEMPLDYMLAVMRDKTADEKRRDTMAAAAAPYVHARLQSTTVKGAGEDGSILIEIVA